MKITIVYDSIFGNTRLVADEIAASLQSSGEVRLLTVQDAKDVDLGDTDLLIIGSPTRGFRPTPMISEYVEGLASASRGKAAAAFDTRLDLETIHPAPLRWVVDAGGYAATRISATLERHGFAMKGPVGGFLVEGTEGPLKTGEMQRARAWAEAIPALVARSA